MRSYEPCASSRFQGGLDTGRSENSLRQHADHGLRETSGGSVGQKYSTPPADSFNRNGHQRIHEDQFIADFETTSYSLPKWCAQLTTLVLRTRTPFAALLAQTFHLPRVPDTVPTVFPVPLPPGEWFTRMPHDLSADKRRRIHLNRVVHIVVLALNAWHYSGRLDIGSLGRAPSPVHQCLYSRIRRLIRSEGLAHFQTLVSSGRRLPQLVARLGELSEALTFHGPSCNPYDRSFPGYDVPIVNDREELRPYRSLDASRLILKGTGHFDASPYLDDELILAYREPRSLLFEADDYGEDSWPATNDPEQEVTKLALLWDKNGLLFLHGGFDLDQEPDCRTRIFNAYKNQLADRQIGDRRARNSCECRVRGPSIDLPCGFDLVDIYCNPKTHYIAIGITDRKDFYHQFHATESRSRSNTVGPPVPARDLEGTHAYAEFVSRAARLRYQRSLHGDRLGWRGSRRAQKAPQFLFVCFKSVLQGDHAGVDIATCAHASLLESYGLLHESCRVRGSRPIEAKLDAEGLCIDDYFALSVEALPTEIAKSRAALKIQRALRVYEEHGILGSPEKDVLSDKAKVVGAVVNSSLEARKRDMILLGAPIEKRLAMSLISLRLASLSHTTDALHSCLLGGWISALMFRRPLMSCFSKVFSMTDLATLDPAAPKMIPLTRGAANELVLVSVLMPFAVTELSAGFINRVYCTDSSSQKGAICSAPCSLDMSEVLWKTCKSKGAYSRLLSPVEVEIRKRQEIEEPAEDHDWQSFQHTRRPLAYRFSFIEIFAGSAKITAAMSERGWSVGPPIDLTFSPEYDVSMPHVMSWLSYLITEHLIESFAVEPPCTTFSVMRRPALRSKDQPYGFDPLHAQTATGNSLALRGLQCMELGRRFEVPGWLETPYSSKLKFLPPYIALRNKPETDFCRTDSCCFGSEHLKSFAFLSVLAPLHKVRKRCACLGKHVVVEGKFTKSSAIYTDLLAVALAELLIDAMLHQRSRAEEFDSIKVAGLENVLVNAVAQESSWKVDKVWTFKKPSHINIQESISVLKLAEILAKEKKPIRVVNLVDSNVVRCALSKGRSSSRGLTPVISKFGSILFLQGCTFACPFVRPA